jgi:hypothetical protein
MSFKSGTLTVYGQVISKFPAINPSTGSGGAAADWKAVRQELRFASDSALEEGGFETSVPRHGEVRAALHYSISGGVCGTGSGAAFDRGTI